MIIKKLLDVVWLVLILTNCVFSQVFSQNKTIIYEMGRPNALDYNIAKRIVGKQYKLVFVYVGQNLTDSLGVEHFEKLNRISIKKKSKKYGEEWMIEFNKKTASELSVHQSISTIIKNTKEYKNITNNELYILYDRRRCCKKSYHTYVVGRLLINDEYQMKTVLRLRVNSKNKQIKGVKEKEMPLPFKFVENGVF